MGFLDALLGGKRKLKAPASDRLFAMTTAQVTLETGLGLKHRNVAGIAFQAVATADFKEIVGETEELLRSAAADTGTTVETSADEYGYRWIVLRDDDFEDLVVAINMVASTMETGGYGDRLLAAVFAFEEEGRPSALSSALLKISGTMERVPEQDLRAAQQLSAFFIIPPTAKTAVRTLFMDHPPTEKRIERLQRYEAELQGTLSPAA